MRLVGWLERTHVLERWLLRLLDRQCQRCHNPKLHPEPGLNTPCLHPLPKGNRSYRALKELEDFDQVFRPGQVAAQGDAVGSGGRLEKHLAERAAGVRFLLDCCGRSCPLLPPRMEGVDERSAGAERLLGEAFLAEMPVVGGSAFLEASANSEPVLPSVSRLSGWNWARAA